MDDHVITGDDPRIPALAKLGDQALEALAHALRTYNAVIEAAPDGHPWDEDANVLPLLTRLIGAAQLYEDPGVVPHDCTSCGHSMAHCDHQMATAGRPCCGACHVSDTHGDTDWEATCARMARVRADLEPF